MSVDEALAALEAKVLGSPGVSGFLEQVAAIRLAVAMGATEAEVAALIRKLDTPKLDKALRAALLAAVNVGAINAADLAGVDVQEVTVSASTLETSRGFDAEASDRIDAAIKLVAAGAALDAALAPVYATANSVTQRVTSGVIGAAGDGVRAVAEEAKLPVVWVAETNACVHCLAYSGQVAEPGKKFPGGLTYGKKSYHPEPLPSPPLHPHCRCTLEPLNDQSYADALRREADRSVLRGFSLESESMATRIDAAERLLDKGVTAPQSVKTYAYKAIKDGKFPTRDR